MLESNAIGNLKNLENNRGQYREWSDKLKNAVGGLREGGRKVLEWVETLRDKEVTQQDYEEKGHSEQFDKFNEENFAVLIDKTEGEARLRIKSAQSGQGLEAYRRLHQWFTMTSGLGLAERRHKIMLPTRASKSEEMLAR